MNRGQRCHHDKYGRDWRHCDAPSSVGIASADLFGAARLEYPIEDNDGLRTSRLSAPGDTLTLRWMPERNCERFAP